MLALQPATDLGVDVLKKIAARTAGIDHLGHAGIVIQAQRDIGIRAPRVLTGGKPVSQMHRRGVTTTLQYGQVEVEIRLAA